MPISPISENLTQKTFPKMEEDRFNLSQFRYNKKSTKQIYSTRQVATPKTISKLSDADLNIKENPVIQNVDKPVPGLVRERVTGSGVTEFERDVPEFESEINDGTTACSASVPDYNEKNSAESLFGASNDRQMRDPEESQINEVVKYLKSYHLKDFKQAIINSDNLKSQLAQSRNFYIFNIEFDVMILLTMNSTFFLMS
jgi:hypothetical protein